MTAQTDGQRLDRGRSVALGRASIGAPVVWATQMEFIYALSPWACSGARLVLDPCGDAVCHCHRIGGRLPLLRAIGKRRAVRLRKRMGARFLASDSWGAGAFVSLVAAGRSSRQGIASVFFDGCGT